MKFELVDKHNLKQQIKDLVEGINVYTTDCLPTDKLYNWEDMYSFRHVKVLAGDYVIGVDTDDDGRVEKRESKLNSDWAILLIVGTGIEDAICVVVGDYKARAEMEFSVIDKSTLKPEIKAIIPKEEVYCCNILPYDKLYHIPKKHIFNFTFTKVITGDYFVGKETIVNDDVEQRNSVLNSDWALLLVLSKGEIEPKLVVVGNYSA